MKKVHYSWVICLACTLLLFTTMGLVANIFSVYRPYILSQYRFTNTQCAMITTVRCLFSFFSMFIIRVYYRRISLRRGTLFAVILSAAAYAVYGAASSIGLFYLGAALAGLGYGLGTMFPISILIDRWFAQKKALALSLCSIGSGIAPILLPPPITLLIQRLGVSTVFFLQAGLMLLLGGIIFLLLRNDPQELHLRPYGTETAEDTAPGKILRAKSRPLSAREWVFLGSCILLFGALSSSGDSNIALLFTNAGYSPLSIAFALSLFGILLSLGKFLYGNVVDHIGAYRANYFFGGALITGQLLCCLARTQQPAVLYLSMIFRGLGLPLSTVGYSMWAADFSDSATYSQALQRIQLFHCASSLAFEAFPGILADLTGSYVPAYLCFAAFSVLSITGVQALYLHRKKQQAASPLSPARR